MIKVKIAKGLIAYQQTVKILHTRKYNLKIMEDTLFQGPLEIFVRTNSYNVFMLWETTGRSKVIK